MTTTVEINVREKAVFISLSDKVLFKTGSYQLSNRANEILGKVATVINSKPTTLKRMEGHTDDVPYKMDPLLDNWDFWA